MAIRHLGDFRSRKHRHSQALDKEKCIPCGSASVSLGATTTTRFSSVKDFKDKVKGYIGVIKLTTLVDTWEAMGADEGLILSFLNDTPCVGIIVNKTLARGKPPSSNRSALDNAILTATDLLINFIKSIGVEYCLELCERLVVWVLNKFGPSSVVGTAIGKLSRSGFEFACKILLDFIDDAIFRQYIAPFINDIFGKEIFRENRVELKEFGLTPAEREEVNSCYQDMNIKTDMLRSSLTAGNSQGFPPLPPPEIPPSPPAEVSVFEGVDTSSKKEIDSHKTLYIIGGSVVALTLIVTTIMASKNKRPMPPPPRYRPPPQARSRNRSEHSMTKKTKPRRSK